MTNEGLLLPARRVDQPHDDPDRDHDHCAEQEISPDPAHGVEAHIPDCAEKASDAVDDIPGIEPEHRQDDTHQHRHQDQPAEHGKWRATENPRGGVWHWSLRRLVCHRTLIYHVRPVSMPASIFSKLSRRSASPGGLSQRSRLMRGKRMAMPDLWRVERCKPSNATSSTKP